MALLLSRLARALSRARESRSRCSAAGNRPSSSRCGIAPQPSSAAVRALDDHAAKPRRLDAVAAPIPTALSLAVGRCARRRSVARRATSRGPPPRTAPYPASSARDTFTWPGLPAHDGLCVGSLRVRSPLVAGRLRIVHERRGRRSGAEGPDAFSCATPRRAHAFSTTSFSTTPSGRSFDAAEVPLILRGCFVPIDARECTVARHVSTRPLLRRGSQRRSSRLCTGRRHGRPAARTAQSGMQITFLNHADPPARHNTYSRSCARAAPFTLLPLTSVHIGSAGVPGSPIVRATIARRSHCRGRAVVTAGLDQISRRRTRP